MKTDNPPGDGGVVRRRVEAILAAAPHSILYEHDGDQAEVTLVSPDGLGAAQVGFAISPDGQSLVGTDGQWRPDWLVVGFDDDLGDPVFIDVGDPSLPVYTATHGVGFWRPVQLASSFASFVASA